jgi:phosphate transport system protein
MADHILKKIDADTAALRERVATMAAAVDEQLTDAMTLVERCYLERGLAVDKQEGRVNELQLQIDRDMTHFIALHQPSAGDLRAVLGMSRVAGNLEAIGNEAARIARAGERIHKVSRKQLPAATELLALHGRTAVVLRSALHAVTDAQLGQAMAAYQALPAAVAAADVAERALRQLLATGADRSDPIIDALTVCRALADIAAQAVEMALHVGFVASGVDLRHAEAAQVTSALQPAA